AMTVQGRNVWVLPGPPRELEGLWEASVASAVAGLVPGSERLTTRMWRTVGKGESAIAEIVEKILGRFRTTMNPVGADELILAFRAHAPIIETKLSFAGAEQQHFQDLFKAIDEGLAPWLYEKDDE